MQELVEIDPLLPHNIYSTFDIRHFGRYQPGTLQKQLERFERPSNDPVSLAVLAVDDHDNALRNPEDSFGLIDPIYTEADSVQGIDEAILMTRERQGPISSLILDGHSGKDRLVLDGLSELNVDNVDEITSLATPRARDVFTAGASIVLSGCYAGKRGGIAEALSRVVGGMPVFASPACGNLKIKPGKIPGTHELVFWDADSNLASDMLRAIGKVCDTDISAFIETEVSKIYSAGIKYVNGKAEPAGSVNLLDSTAG
jgi:hypothetical protein